MLRRTFLTLLVCAGSLSASDSKSLAIAVDSIGITVSDLDRAVDGFHAFLDHDSWLDCTECYDGGFTARSLEAHVKTARRCIVGTISNDVRAAIVGVVEASRLLSPAEKAEILAALS